jgi:prophage regulatory protein
MTDPSIIDDLAASIARHTARRIPLAVDLWGYAEIAAYLKMAHRHVSDRVATLPGFPAAIRIPTRGAGRGQPRYKASEVIAWVESHKERS